MQEFNVGDTVYHIKHGEDSFGTLKRCDQWGDAFVDWDAGSNADLKTRGYRVNGVVRHNPDYLRLAIKPYYPSQMGDRDEDI